MGAASAHPDVAVPSAAIVKPPVRKAELRKDATRRRVLLDVLERYVDLGHYQVPLNEMTRGLGRRSSGPVVRIFGARRLLMACVARHDPARVVDSIGLSPQARATLSDRDVKALAYALLAGRKRDAL